MSIHWGWWLAAVAVALGSAATLPRRGGGRRMRGLVWALAAVVVAYPLLQAGARAGVAWLYTAAPPALADRLMPSRGVLGLAHYQGKAGQALDALLAAAAGAAALARGLAAWRAAPTWRRRARAAWQHPLSRALRGGLLLAGLAFAGYNAWLHAQFVQPHPVFYTDCRKVWGHRGHPEPPDIPENTIASYRRAFDLGAPGVEMDVRYDPDRREYFIGRYDRGQAPPPGQRLLLQDVFAALGDRGYFWLDIKTIRYLNAAQAQQAAADMAALLDAYDLRERAIIESDRPSNLAYFAQAGLHTSYWVFNIDETTFPTTPWGQWWALVQVKRNYIQGGFSAISMDRRFYTPLVAWMLRGARIHLFTVDAIQELQSLTARPEVRVILTNTDRYDITACP